MASSCAAAVPSPSSASGPPKLETIIQSQDPQSDAQMQAQSAENSAPSNSPSDEQESIIVSMEGDSIEEKEGEEEEEECGFCIFMKGGGCKEEFVAWEKCVGEAEKAGVDIVDGCYKVSILLKKCMDAHADYYEPILKVEQEMEDAISELETEKQSEKEVVK